MDLFSCCFIVFIIIPVGILLWRVAIAETKAEDFLKRITKKDKK